MRNSGAFNITAHGDREIVVTRIFDAPRQLVFDAYTKPALIKRWLLGPDGWSMPVCEIDLRVGGKYRYVWKSDSDGSEMGMGGVYREVIAPERIVATEVFDEAWYPGEAVDTIVFVEQEGKTTLTQTILYNSRETRDAVLKSPMQTGMAASYDRLEKFLPSLKHDALSA
ncbi:MAG: SRPBCC family protein [Candidatus Sulfotelmatobacter sp.]